jgi:hypothetical protein
MTEPGAVRTQTIMLAEEYRLACKFSSRRKPRMRCMRGFVTCYPRDRSRCIKMRVTLRRLVIALFCSTEPTGKFRRIVVIRASKSQSSIRDRRISSVIVNTGIVSSIVIGRANRGLVTEARAMEEGCIACDRNEEEECFALAAISRRTVPNDRKKDVIGAVIDGEGECLRLT